jgi:hypothetical protein
VGFRLIKQGKSSEIFTDNENDYLEWRRILVSCCILLHFHDFYNVDKMLGKGNFARVKFKFFTELKNKRKEERKMVP